MSVRIVSYNLLVPKLAEQPGFFYKCNPNYLRWEYRWNLIQFRLKQEILYNRNTIICLQEVSHQTLPQIQLFFKGLKYVLLSNLYGDDFQDNMGVAIAIPDSIKVTSVLFIKIGDQIRSRLTNKQSSLFKRMKLFFTNGFDNNQQNSTDPWEISAMKANVLICLHVYVDGQPLCIGTYHMPALFRMTDVMMIHAAFVKDLMLQLANGINMILAGDFNSKPTDDYYHVITQQGFADGRLPKSNIYRINYRPASDRVLRSAYREMNGSEPLFTNYSTTKNSPSFCATLDYIFFDGRLTVEKVLSLPKSYPQSKSYPDREHPSDHLMIAATFRFI